MGAYDVAYPSPAGDLGEAAHGPSSKKFFSLMYDREAFLVRARRQSRLTLSFIFREIGENSTTTETLPWQTLGGQGVLNMANKLIQAMFPVDVPWAQLSITKEALKAASAMSPADRGTWREAVEAGLSQVQQDFLQCVAEDNDANELMQCGIALVIGGNYCLKIDEKTGQLDGRSLEDYVTLRDRKGKLIEFILEDGIPFASLDPDLQSMVEDKGLTEATAAGKEFVDPKSVSIYTHGKLRDGTWKITQECWGEEVPGSAYERDEDSLPYMFLRLVGLKKENYGRSYCEYYEGDLQAYDGMSQFLIESGHAIAQLKWLVKPGGVTNKKAFAEAANGDVLTGNVEDVAAVRADKGGDLSTVYQVYDKVEKRLERAFVLDQAATRDAERVTGVEIQAMIRALNSTIGGVYASLSSSWQFRYAQQKIRVLQKLGRLTKLPKGLTKIAIRSGEEALNSDKQAQDLDEYFETAAQALTPQVVAPYADVYGYLSRKAAKKGIPLEGLIKPPAQVQQEQQQQKMDEMTSNVAPEVVKQGGGMLQAQQQAGLDAQAQGQPQDQPPQQQQPQGQ